MLLDEGATYELPRSLWNKYAGVLCCSASVILRVLVDTSTAFT